ncbi:MAG: hypothetical protein H6752_01180 [Candidatus Omnitrophica bacterium]|nr:hypothetical protein [Candidatus Omnitrophota bacterium]
MPTPILSQIYRIGLLIIVAIPWCANAGNDIEEFRLFPGESYTSMGVTVSWDVANSTDESVPTQNSLRMMGPETVIEGVDIQPSEFEEVAYLDDVAIGFKADTIQVQSNAQRSNAYGGGRYGNARYKVRSLGCRAWGQSSEISVLHRIEEPRYFVSHVCPIKINQILLTVSSDKVDYPDGSKYLEMVATDTITDETQTIPAANDAVKSIGRFTVAVGRAFEETKTVVIQVSAEPDLTIRGKDAWVEDYSFKDSTTLEKALSDLGDRYGFKADWEAFEGKEESIDYGKNLNVPEMTISAGRPLKEVLELLGKNELDDKVTFEWETPTLLSVYPIGYKEVRDQQQRAKQIEQAKKEFEKNYQLETQVYKLSKITPVTAKALIERELRSYQLSGTEVRSYPLGTGSERSTWVVEQCIADEKANAVIVTAIPETHKKVEELLAKMEGVLEAEQKEKAAPLQLYKVEVALLQSAEPQTDEATPEYWEALDTVVEDLNVQGDSLYQLVELLATFGETSINCSQTVPDLGVHVTLKGKTIREILNTLSKMYDLWIDYQPETVLIRPTSERAVTHLVDPKDYGLGQEDLNQFNVEAVSELGRSNQSITNSVDRGGSFSVTMGEHTCEFTFQDFRDPYLIVNGRVQGESKTLIDSTLFLEQNKPSVLAITNMRDTLILVVRLLEIR